MDKAIRVQLAGLEQRLLDAPARLMFETKSWAEDVPAEGGVYVVWDLEFQLPVYVGETSGLRARMGDIGRMENHTFRRKAAALLNLESGDEATVSAAMAKRFAVSFIEVEFGRAELEEFLVLRWRDTIVNKPAKRLLRGSRYRWVDPARPRFRGVTARVDVPPKGNLPSSRY
jgi:hypothetical protein